jgi:Fe2+ or Zn2+ uptake regulation protein
MNRSPSWQNRKMPHAHLSPGRRSASTNEPTTRRLRDRGLRATRPRITILDFLIETEGHWDAAVIADHARDRLGTISLQAVYDVLDALTRTGLVRRIEPMNRAALYEARVGDNHHHLVCNVCGRVDNLDCATDIVPCLEPSQDHGFEIDEAEVCWYGLCGSCTPS